MLEQVWRLPRGESDFVTVVVPEQFRRRALAEEARHPFEFALKLRLLTEPGVVVADVPTVDESPDGRPLAVRIFVSGANAASMRALNWAEAVGLPDTRAVNFAFDETEAAAMRRKWLAADARVPLEVLAAPYRDIGDPLLAYLRELTGDGNDVLVVLPELILRGWARLLHNQRALYVKRLLLVEPNVILASVPYHLRHEAPRLRVAAPPSAAPRALDGLDRLPEHRRAAARPGGDGARRSTSPAGSPPIAAPVSSSSRRSSSSASCRSTRTWTPRLTGAEGAARVRGRGGASSYGVGVRREIVRTRPGSLGEDVARVAAERRAELVVVGAPVESRRGFHHAFPREVLAAAARRAVPRDDRHRPGCRRGASDRGGHYSPAVARRRRQANELERVLGANALFATAYGNVGSSIYYALGVTAVFALGLTPAVFVIAGIFFAATAATYAEGTVRYPEAGGSSSFARHAFNELVSFGAAWAQMLNYVITIAISAFFVPHYLSIFWEPLRQNPWDIIGGAVVIAVLVALNIVGIQESARLNIVLAVVDFATQLLLVLLGFFLIFSPSTLAHNVHFGAWRRPGGSSSSRSRSG